MSERKIGILPAMTAADGSGGPRPFAEILRDTEEIESLGLDSVWAPDHLFVEASAGTRTATPEPLALLSALASRTGRITLGTLVSCQGFRHPGMLAKSAATLSEISGGRFVLGIGAGWHQPEFDAFGLPFDHLAGRFEEYVTILSDLLRGNASTLSGRYFTTRAASIPGASGTPLWVAAAGDRMIESTARYADGWNLAWYGENISEFVADLDRAQGKRSEIGHPQRLTTSVGVLTVPVGSDSEAEGVWEQLLGTSALRSTSRENIARRVIIAGPKRTAEILRGYWDAGVDHIILSVGPAPASAWSPDSIRVFGEEVLPLLRH